MCCVLAIKRSNRGAKDTGAPKSTVAAATIFVNTSLAAGMPQLVLAYLQSIQILFPPYSAFKNEITVPGGSVGTCKSAEKSTEEVPQRESESSSNISDSDQENSTPSTAHCTLHDDECVETMHSAISSGDLGQVAQLKAKRKLMDHEKLTILSTHFVPPRNYMFPTCNVGGCGHCFQHGWLKKHNA